MATRVFPFRWFNNVSIAKKLYFTVGIMALLIAVELFMLLFCLSTLSSLRAYVGGEGLWSKAQKDAAFHLYRYGVSHNEKDYDLFKHFMQVPIGDAKARQELLTGNPDISAARKGFIEGRNHPDDIEGMISLFVRFGNVYYIEKAIKVWGEAQAIAMELLPIADGLHRTLSTSGSAQSTVDQYLASTYAIDEKLTKLEDEFSFTLGEGSRWLERVVLRLLFATAITVEATGLVLTISVSRGIHKGLTDIIGAAELVANGRLSTRATVLSHDEIGEVAKSFNGMADNLQTQVGQLASLNQHLRQEVSAREQVETELKRTLSELEKMVQQLERQISERERAEEISRESAKMKALGQLTGGIAHDFNNLLAVIIGSAELLLDARENPAEHAELAREILDTALRGSHMTRRLLAVGRQQLLQPQCVDLNALLTNHVEMLRRILGPEIHISLTQAPDLWLTTADPSQIEDALLNLALNSRDAMPEGGKLVLKAANVHLDEPSAAAYAEMTEGDYVVLSVEDTGIGMPQAVVERAVEPFFTTKPPSAGSGLGLSMIYGFAKQSGGHLAIESVVGSGTSVKLYLPRIDKRAEAALVAQQDVIPDPRGSEAILIVDDNPNLLMLVRRQLTALGYRVFSADSGAAAMAILAAEETVDLLFTDLAMPGGMNGYKLAEAARNLRPNLRILFTTGYAAGLSNQSERHVLQKPYGRRELASAIRSALDGAAAMVTGERL